MFKKSLIMLSMVAFFYTASAQIEFESGKTHTYVMPHSGTTDCHLVFRNLTGKTANFVYRKVQEDYPTAWWVSFCDNINCYASFIDQDTFAPIADSGFAEFKISVTPNGKADTSTVKYVMYEAATPNNLDTITFVFVVEWGAGLEKPVGKTVQVYPNPATDYLTFQNASSNAVVNIYDNKGQLVKTEILRNGGVVSIADIPKGLYFITFRDGEQIIRSGFVKN